MTENNSTLAHEVIEELWATRETLPLQPTADIDLVWVVSTPGTVKELPDIPPYDAALTNLALIKEGIGIVSAVTGLRLDKPANDINGADIDAAGPILLYNGESAAAGDKYAQNEHLRELAAQPGFLIPPSKLVVADIEEINTPGQIKQLAGFVEGSQGKIRKIAVVSGYQHSVRVGRYLEHHRELFPEGVEFVNAAVGLSDNESAIAAVEARKVLRYYRAGHLARNSYFDVPHVPSGRADFRRSPTQG